MTNCTAPVAGVIFDMDGTILDSSPMWDSVAGDILLQWGYTPKESLRADVHPLGAVDMAPFMKKDYSMTQSVAQINEAINARIYHYYTRQAQLKPGALELLKTMKAKGLRLAVLSATAMDMVEAALRLTGAWELFDTVVSCDDLGCTKFTPEPFYEVLGRLGTGAENTWVFEDALYAIETARSIGLATCAVEDMAAAYQREEVKQTACCYLEEFSQWPQRLPFAHQLL